MSDLKGIITAMVTPFSEKDESLDVAAARNMASWLIEHGVHGLFIGGTNGEFHLLNDDEKELLTREVVDEVAGRVPVIAGAGCCGTTHTCELSRRLADAGADYISLVTPYYLVPKQPDLRKHYETIASSTDAKLILYNIPGQTGCKIEPETADALADVDNIVGIKDSGGDFDTQLAYIEISKHKDFGVFNGSDSLMLKAFKAGSAGSVAATSNVIPEIEVALYDAFVAGDFEKAQAERDKMDLLRMTLKKCVAPAVMKATLNLMGVPAGITRKPISMPDDNVMADVHTMLAEYGIPEA